MKQKGYEVMMSIAQVNKVKRQQATGLFARNFAVLLAEKGWENHSMPQLVVELNRCLGRKVFSKDTVRIWCKGMGLPNYASFLMLAEALDCYEEGLLPDKYLSMLSGYWLAD